MNKYELITNAIRLAPFLIMILVGISLSKEKTSVRISTNAVAGWIAIIVSTFIYWHYAVEYAPSEELRHELTLKDSGAKTGSIFIGWVYSLVFVLLFEAFRWLSFRVSSIVDQGGQMNLKPRSNKFAEVFEINPKNLCPRSPDLLDLNSPKDGKSSLLLVK